ncbi:5e9f199e-d259-43c8-855c-898ba664a14d [Thermothielavioides terrestris]|uniref:5e9f199e-d259-43c8-855c-898ba664a14d n=1 Tax=Thermothielavioides terrestris TaxID=2587410 RepID=A0A446B7I4_9PEZI|nr:5e9f199e-d259-43c8-855c-898ba664a14d [Thermothielavioides terrestris]
MEAREGSPGVNDYMNLTAAERDTIQHIERLGAAISLFGVCLIFLTYGAFKRVRTVPNTFIFFASIANVGASIACLIGYAGLAAGDSSALCQAQAFLLEMFMQSDPWWSFAMAVNVYMVFFMSYPPNDLHKHLWLYCLICFGIPAIPALICLFYAPNGQRIYGNATLWCWISDSYSQLRIFTYYLPIWACISLSAVIYVAVGYHVFRQRNQLRNLTLSNQAKDVYGTELSNAIEKKQQAYGTVTTEVRVTAESSGSQTPPSTPEGSIAPVLHRAQTPAARPDPWGLPPFDSADDYEADPISPTTIITTATVTAIHPPGPTPPSPASPPSDHARPPLPPPPLQLPLFAAKLANLDPIKLAYLRTSFVFALSILVTWTPSSINRVYALAYPQRASYALNLAGAVVLPLQGLWNAVIFAATSWNVLKAGDATFKQ